MAAPPGYQGVQAGVGHAVTHPAGPRVPAGTTNGEVCEAVAVEVARNEQGTRSVGGQAAVSRT